MMPPSLPELPDHLTALRLLEEADQAIIRFTRDWRFAYLNPAAQRMIRRRSEDLLGRVVWEEYPDIIGTPFRDRGLQAQEEGREITYEEYYPPLATWFRIRAVPDPGGEVTYFLQDITPARMKRALRVIDAGLVGILQWTLDGGVTEANDTCLKMVGYDRADLRAGRINWRAITPPEWTARDEQALEELRRTGRHAAFEKEYIRKNGTRVPLLVGGALFEGSDREGVSFLLDLTRLKETQERLRLALLSGGLGTWDIDRLTGRMTFSEEVPPFYGRPRAVTTLDPEEWFSHWVHPDDRDRMRAVHANTGPTTPEAQFRTLWPDGSTYRWVASYGLNIRDEAGNPVRSVGYTRDITAEKEREAERDTMLRRHRLFMRDLVSSLTEGKFRLCFSESELPEPPPATSRAIELTPPTLSRFRQEVTDVARQLDFPVERTYDLLTAAGEASMNAVTHGGGGLGWVCVGEDGDLIRIWISDHGRGISEEALPRVLEKGMSTTGTLGHGFWLILRCADRCYLLTGPGGTTVVLEQERNAPVPGWLARVSHL
ncbi:MAG: PAS domain S-box protein [Capsulimonadales bacterium]|nr:PAS domain S-box protein [Capsulimonadales bacterium]